MAAEEWWLRQQPACGQEASRPAQCARHSALISTEAPRKRMPPPTHLRLPRALSLRRQRQRLGQLLQRAGAGGGRRLRVLLLLLLLLHMLLL